MKNLILFLCVIILFVSCKPVTPPPHDEAKKTKADSNIAFVKDLYKAVDAENIEAVAGFYSDSASFVGPSFNSWTGKEEMIKNMTSLFKNADSIRFDIFAIMAEPVKEGDLAGDWVMLWANVSFYDLNVQKKIMLMYHATEKIEDGKIVVEGNYWNEWDAFKQMGAELKWPEKKK